MTPKELYNLILSLYVSEETSLCKLHNPCALDVLCNDAQVTLVLDFDRVEREYHGKKKFPSSASVDGLTYKNDSMLFIEIKGWKQFLINQGGKVNQLKIQKQTDKYDLKKKFVDSVAICSDIAGDANLLDAMTAVYIIVTDIKIEQNGLASIAMGLDVLANTSSDWNRVCVQLMQTKINSINNVKTHYLYCEDFDSFFHSY